MFGDKRSPVLFLVLSIAFAATLLSVFSCSEMPTAIDQQTDRSGLAGSGEIDAGNTGSFLLGSVSGGNAEGGYLEVWGSGVAYDSSAGVVSFDIQILNRTRRAIAPPIHFVVTETAPSDIAVLEFDGVSFDGFPFFDFSGKLGEDGLLTPREKTQCVTLRFHTATARSFAIAFRIDLGMPEGAGIIGGTVYLDHNRSGARDSCDQDPCEPGMPGITVALEKPLSNGDMVTLISRTDVNGQYSFGRLNEGVYKVFVCAPEEKWDVTTPNPLLVTLVEGPDGQVQNFIEADFGLYPLMPHAPDNLFGPILVGPLTPFGTTLDSTFINPPSLPAVVYGYYLEVVEPPFMHPFPNVIDSASAWINEVMVYGYQRAEREDSSCFAPQKILLPDSLVSIGENAIRLATYGDEHSALLWRVYRTISGNEP